MGHLARVEVFTHGNIGCRANRTEYRQNLLLFDQFAHLLYSFGREITVVPAYQPDLATVDAALGVQHLEVGKLSAANLTVHR